MITYKYSGNTVSVYLNGSPVGSICAVQGGYQYFPRGSSIAGDIFPTIAAVKRSLEN